MYGNVGIDENGFYALDPSLPIDFDSHDYTETEKNTNQEGDYDDQEERILSDI